MVTESKAPVELRHAAARNGAISELENAEAKAFALLAAGDYEARLAACGQVIHLADVISDDAVISDDVVIERLAVACLERLIQHLSQIILQFNEVKPDAEMVLQSFSPVGSVKFSRDIKPNLKVAAHNVHDDADRLLYILKRLNNDEISESKSPGYTRGHGGPVGDAAENAEVDIITRVRNMSREKLPALAKLIDDFERANGEVGASQSAKATPRPDDAAMETTKRGPRVKPNPALPKTAPAIYRDRKPREELGGKKENIVQFIERVYAPWREILTRADLRRLDRTADAGVVNWITAGKRLPVGLILTEYELNTDKRQLETRRKPQQRFARMLRTAAPTA